MSTTFQDYLTGYIGQALGEPLSEQQPVADPDEASRQRVARMREIAPMLEERIVNHSASQWFRLSQEEAPVMGIPRQGGGYAFPFEVEPYETPLAPVEDYSGAYPIMPTIRELRADAAPALGGPADVDRLNRSLLTAMAVPARLLEDVAPASYIEEDVVQLRREFMMDALREVFLEQLTPTPPAQAQDQGGQPGTSPNPDSGRVFYHRFRQVERHAFPDGFNLYCDKPIDEEAAQRQLIQFLDTAGIAPAEKLLEAVEAEEIDGHLFSHCIIGTLARYYYNQPLNLTVDPYRRLKKEAGFSRMVPLELDLERMVEHVYYRKPFKQYYGSNPVLVKISGWIKEWLETARKRQAEAKARQIENQKRKEIQTLMRRLLARPAIWSEHHEGDALPAYHEAPRRGFGPVTRAAYRLIGRRLPDRE